MYLFLSFFLGILANCTSLIYLRPITDPKSENLYKFSTQLHAYKFALENPADGQSKIVSRVTTMGLLVISPEEVEFRDGKIFFYTQPQWIPFEEDMEGFFDFVDEVVAVLEGRLPEPTDNCAWCKYRSLTEPTLPKRKDDVPF